MITPLICVTICLKRYLVLKENTNKIPGEVHPGTKVYQEWGNILANRINTSFSRSAGVAGASRPSSPHKALDPCPVDDCSTDRQWVSQTGSTKTIKSDHGNRGTKNINNHAPLFDIFFLFIWGGGGGGGEGGGGGGGGRGDSELVTAHVLY